MKKTKNKNGSASFYTHPVEDNNYVDSKLIYTFREKLVPVWKKKSARYNVYNIQNEIHFSHNLSVLEHKTLNPLQVFLYSCTDGYKVFNFFNDKLSVVFPKRYQFIFQPLLTDWQSKCIKRR